MKILVTGATGFIGSWLVKKLNQQQDTEVTILARQPAPHALLEGCLYDVAIGDITKPETLVTPVQDADVIYHLAGFIGYKREERALMEQINVLGTKNLVDLAVKSDRLQRFIHFSSVVAVGAGQSPEQVMDETSPFNLHHLNLGYFETKLAAEKIIQQAFLEHGLPAVMVNPSTVYGAGDATKPSRKTQLKVARGEFKFYTEGGVSVTHIEDVIDATLSAATKGRLGERYILAGENITIKQLFELIAEAAGVPAPSTKIPSTALKALGKSGDLAQRFGLKAPFDSEKLGVAMMYHWFDSRKAREELDYQPRSARDAITESVQWMKDQGLLD